MGSTVLGAEKAIIFISDAHEKFYYEKLKEVRYQDVYHKAKAGQPKARTLKALAAAQKEGEALTPEESERLESHKSRKKTAMEKLVQQAETDPAAAAELAKKRAYQSEATKKSRQKPTTTESHTFLFFSFINNFII